jgi:hypothetical protein
MSRPRSNKGSGISIPKTSQARENIGVESAAGRERVRACLEGGVSNRGDVMSGVCEPNASHSPNVAHDAQYWEVRGKTKATTA